MNTEDKLRLQLKEEQNNAMNEYISTSSETNRLLRILFWPVLAIAFMQTYWVLANIFKG